MGACLDNDEGKGGDLHHLAYQLHQRCHADCLCRLVLGYYKVLAGVLPKQKVADANEQAAQATGGAVNESVPSNLNCHCQMA